MQMPGSDEDIIAVHEAFAIPIFYAPVGTITAVESDDPAADHGGAATARTRTFEILKHKVLRKPQNNDRIDASGRAWYVIEVEDRDDVLAWIVTVEWRA